LTVAELKELRRTLAGNATYAVVKNTLTKIAVRDSGVPALVELEPLLEGPSAIAFVTGDPVIVAKGIRDFAKAHPALIVKGGILDGRPVTPEEIRKLADLESREVLLAKLAGAMMAPAQQLVSVLAAPLAQFARLLAALEAKVQADPSADGEEAAEPVAAEDPVAAEEPAAAAELAAADDPAPAQEAATADEPAAEAPAEAEPEPTDEAVAVDEPPAADTAAEQPAQPPADEQPSTEVVAEAEQSATETEES
jgi:large subunit ribosomal protein L10